MTEQGSDNPLLRRWDTPYGLPPFDRLRPEHFKPALEVAIREHRAEFDRIADNPRAATFDNTVAAFDLCGRRLERIAAAFHNLTTSATDPQPRVVQL
jgi:peptidyl-dipeptidase Dcp